MIVSKFQILRKEHRNEDVSDVRPVYLYIDFRCGTKSIRDLRPADKSTGDGSTH